jgi:2,4-dienoyl-CoA reductase-like NADH-dependent reductase (Old Yellow Enzyme family)
VTPGAASPLTLRAVRVPNRLWMSPMCQYSAAADGPAAGGVTDWHVSHLEARAVGGCGLVMAEATAVDPLGRVSPHDLGAWSDRQVPGLARLAAAVARHGAVPGLQLGHAGPKAATHPPWVARHRRVPAAEGGWLPWSPAPRPDGAEVHEMTTAEVAAVPGRFAAAARRARHAGFRVVEVHAAHGYLLHAFLSPLTNTRTDGYGRDRDRLLMEVAGAVRAEWPADLPLFVRLTGTDWLPGGLTVRDATRLAGKLAAAGVDLVDVSSGGLLPAVIDTHPGYQVPLATAVRAAGVPVAAVGLLEDPELVRGTLRREHADAVFAGRATLRDPYWARRLLAHEGAAMDWPPQYGWAIAPP